VTLEQLLNFIPAFVLAFFRLAGMMIFAPLFGSGRVPRRVRVMIALVLAMSMCGAVHTPVALPDTTWELAVGIGGEMVFGIAMGMILSFVFIAAQWGGEMIGQQMGLNISQVLDPQFGQQGSLIGDLYFMTTTVIFLLIGGHHEILRGVRMSFDALPLLSLGMDRPLLDTLVGLLQAAATMALRLAAPVMVTMLVVDLVLGCLGKTIPQMNVMTAGLTVRSILGLLVLYLAMGPGGQVIGKEISRSLNEAMQHWSTARVAVSTTG
jgi:flagellar biosynthetic protein FliR